MESQFSSRTSVLLLSSTLDLLQFSHKVILSPSQIESAQTGLPSHQLPATSWCGLAVFADSTILTYILSVGC